MAIARDESGFMKPFMSNESSESLEIPLAFNEYLQDPLPIKVELKVSSERSWTVGMKKRGAKVFLTHGWENFVKENNLEDGKLLNFSYDYNRIFDVIIFGHDGCSEFRDFPEVVIDVDDYGISEEEEEEEK